MATYDQPDDHLDPLEDDLQGMPNGGNITGDNQFGNEHLPPDHDEAPQGDGSFGGQGSAYNQQRRHSAADPELPYSDVGRGYGTGRAGSNGDEDRAYDESGTRGGVGSSGGREDLTDRQPQEDTNAFRGGYGGGDYAQPNPDELASKNIGLDSSNSAIEPDQE
ncbi:hypothetical protein MTX78_13815 [Hymenobacter tibetensis]|uniref:Translation initiation factor n=1 Tax=Hymenobacter tibetensis TaxID=497967 RepID=A0ABY4CVK8_9BACT|nr:hypothetical protein [Hymenobacter tibetensis]UOG73200.1 hypothetical protein MTX78_13815 [Hymenobacter tibetensis]